MTTYSEHYAPVFTALGYANSSYQGNYQWTGDTPSAGIIAAVNGLPATANPLYSMFLSQDDAIMTALQALVSGTQWTDFIAWLTTQYKTAVGTLLLDPVAVYEQWVATAAGTGFNAGVVALRSSASAASLDPPV
jgi:hypothetical protein